VKCNACDKCAPKVAKCDSCNKCAPKPVVVKCNSCNKCGKVDKCGCKAEVKCNTCGKCGCEDCDRVADAMRVRAWT
jgi:hypothetical protein